MRLTPADRRYQKEIRELANTVTRSAFSGDEAVEWHAACHKKCENPPECGYHAVTRNGALFGCSCTAGSWGKICKHTKSVWLYEFMNYRLSFFRKEEDAKRQKRPIKTIETANGTTYVVLRKTRYWIPF